MKSIRDALRLLISDQKSNTTLSKATSNQVADSKKLLDKPTNQLKASSATDKAILTVSIIPTGVTGGSGHVSLTVESLDPLESRKKALHVSYAPASPLHAQVAGLTAILPVSASIQKNHLEMDHQEAIEQYSRPLNGKEFERAVSMVRDLEKSVDIGHSLYALAASFSSAPSNAILKAMAYIGAAIEFNRVSRNFGHDNHPEADLTLGKPLEAPVAYNCITAVAGIVKGVYGLHDLECPAIPNNLGLVLESRGFTKVGVKPPVNISDNESDVTDHSNLSPHF